MDFLSNSRGFFVKIKSQVQNFGFNEEQYELSLGKETKGTRSLVLEIDQREQRAQRTKDIWEDPKAGGPKNLIAHKA